MRKHTASARITEELAQAAGGSFSIVYRALSEEARAQGLGKPLRQKSVEKRIQQLVDEKSRKTQCR